jgi:hypothetical protein
LGAASKIRNEASCFRNSDSQNPLKIKKCQRRPNGTTSNRNRAITSPMVEVKFADFTITLYYLFVNVRQDLIKIDTKKAGRRTRLQCRNESSLSAN